MSSPQQEKEIIHREFELERVILFSDAVFAIAITLLIIDVKFPEVPENVENINYWILFKPTLLHFGGLCVSFFFIGMFWTRHLAMFKYLQAYNKGLLMRNLFFLFFIVLFPFSADALASHIRPSFFLPFCIYIANVALCFLMHLWLCHYIFYKKPELSVKGHENFKKYIFLNSKYVTIIIFAALIITIVVSLLYPGNILALDYALILIPFFTIIMRKKLKKYKPAGEII